ncbi:MAG TPA: hypothetical protein VHG90_12215, partial [Acidimicrobiales bacterium]|nr:hypothetical protein [Acidimicrobiales bacterium]
MRLEPLQCRGTWGGLNPLPGATDPTGTDGPLAVLTYGRVHLRSWLPFWRFLPRPTGEALRRPGLMAVMLATEVFAPTVNVITFSLWRSAEEAMAFAYPAHGGEHGEAIGRVEREDWASEMLFARFRPVRSEGTWCGTDPLAGVSGRNVKGAKAMANAIDPMPTVTKAQAVSVAESSLRDLVSMLHSVTRPDARAMGDWTVRDVAAHLCAVLVVYPSILRGEGSPVAQVESIAAWNAEAVRNNAGRDYDAL